MRIRTQILVVASAILLPATADAQRVLHVGLAGGLSIPQGPLSDASNTGWNALGTIWLSTLMQPIGLRLDAAYNQFGFKGGTGVTGNQTIASATLNATYRLPMTNSPMSPYLVTGLGAYRTDCSVATCTAATHFGWNAGLGTKINILGALTFLEARYHRTSANDQSIAFFPVTFGLIF